MAPISADLRCCSSSVSSTATTNDLRPRTVARGVKHGFAYTASICRLVPIVVDLDPESPEFPWYGSLFGLADEVLPACERAVSRQPEAVAFIDSRGLTRALTGNLAGALDDFRMVLSKGGIPEDVLEQRREWVGDLEQGVNPIDDDVLEGLLAGDTNGAPRTP